MGLLLIVCGPSGVGKTSLGRRLRSAHPRLTLSVSCTTRLPRDGEADGVDYHFVSEETFGRMREEGAFAEWAEVHGNLYGTPRSEIEQAWASGRDLFFDIDYQGARQLQASFPDAAVSILVAPPSMEALRERLSGRGTDSEEVIAGRLRAAKAELREYELFDYILFNDDFEETAAELETLYRAARHRRHLQMEQLAPLVE